jgi:hypothetical protein
MKRGWTPTMEQRAGPEGRQIECLIASEGHLWICSYYDRLPPAVRRRLAESDFNICPACMMEEAHRAAPRPTSPPILQSSIRSSESWEIPDGAQNQTVQNVRFWHEADMAIALRNVRL